jgi:hypothetical protein
MVARFLTVLVAAPFVAVWLRLTGRTDSADTIGARWAAWVAADRRGQ